MSQSKAMFKSVRAYTFLTLIWVMPLGRGAMAAENFTPRDRNEAQKWLLESLKHAGVSNLKLENNLVTGKVGGNRFSIPLWAVASAQLQAPSAAPTFGVTAPSRSTKPHCGSTRSGPRAITIWPCWREKSAAVPATTSPSFTCSRIWNCCRKPPTHAPPKTALSFGKINAKTSARFSPDDIPPAPARAQRAYSFSKNSQAEQEI